jgi:hypothetical protein
MQTAPNRTVPEARNEATSDISRLPRKKPGLATLSQRKTTTNTPNIITDRCPWTESGHRKRRSRRTPVGVTKERARKPETSAVTATALLG